MGKVREPKRLMLDKDFEGTPEALELLGQGHLLYFVSFDHVDLIISPIAQMTPMGRLGYVVKKLKEIVREVKGA